MPHFILYGLSRLAVQVAQPLGRRGAAITIIHGPEGQELAPLVASFATLQVRTHDRELDLRTAGIESADGVLALSDDDLENLRVAVAARAVAPDVPVTVHSLDPILADQLEHGLGLRRAYSVSALAAPAVVAAVLGQEVVEAIRIGAAVTPICCMDLEEGSPLPGLSPAEVKKAFHCALIARAGRDREWRASQEQGSLEHGDRILVGGLLPDVLRLARLNSRLFRPPAGSAPRVPARGRPEHHRNNHPFTLLPVVAATLALIVFSSVFVFHRELHLRWVDAIYFTVTTLTTTGFGDYALRYAPDWVKLYGALVMLSGGGLLAVLFSYVATIVTAERVETTMERRARRLTGHVVMCGLGKVGYRVARHFVDLGLPLAVVELSPDPRFVDSLRARTPILTGDARIPENLERANIRSAAVFLACTNDELANIQACLHARRLNPIIRTVAHVFEEQFAERLAGAAHLGDVVSSTGEAATAFVGAALGPNAIREFTVGGLSLAALRYRAREPIEPETVEEWRARGIRVLGVRRKGAGEQAPSQLEGTLQVGDEVSLCGPTDAISTLIASR